jgi:hypothetical protein
MGRTFLVTFKNLNVIHNWSNDKQMFTLLNKRRFLLKVRLKLLNYSSSKRIISTVENENLSLDLSKLGIIEFYLFPTPSVFKSREIFDKIDSNFDSILIFINDSKREKEIVNEIVLRTKLLDSSTKVIVFGTNYRGDIQKNLIFLPKVQMTNEAYFDYLANSKLVIFFYSQENYESLTSGRFMDCIVAQKNIWIEREFTALDWLIKKYPSYCNRFSIQDENWINLINVNQETVNNYESLNLPTAINSILILNNYLAARKFPDAVRTSILFLNFVEFVNIIGRYHLYWLKVLAKRISISITGRLKHVK